MNKNQNTITKVIVAILVFLIAIVGVRKLTQPKVVEGNKKIDISIVDHNKETVYSKTLSTDAELLGELFDEMMENEEVTFVFEGEKGSGMGRYFTQIDDLKQDSDETKGYFWVFESDTNENCAEFCPGIDETPLNDNDAFTLKLTNEFN